MENPQENITVGGKTTTEKLTEKLKKPTIRVYLIVFLAMNVTMFIAGIVTIKDCSLRPIIPIYLTVAGALGIVTKLIPFANWNRRSITVDRLVYVLFALEFVWMILGSHWIYSIYRPNYLPELGPYCNKTGYLLAFWLLTVHYIILFFALVTPYFILCYLIGLALRDPSFG